MPAGRGFYFNERIKELRMNARATNKTNKTNRSNYSKIHKKFVTQMFLFEKKQQSRMIILREK
ncbi:MAG: hypothetical protein DRZ79_03960 [Candidatus Cloacimonadota bacterium]|nr:MAG: hypothetical protein DRZ79_03960 [Candidatus Cloacimonadota bacterium]